MIQAGDRAFTHNDIVERVVGAHAILFAEDLAVHHGPRVEIATTLLNAVQSGIQVLQRYFRQKPERPQIDSQHRDPGSGHRPRG